MATESPAPSQPRIRKAAWVRGRTLVLRNATEADAAFILSLRTDEARARYLSATPPQVEAQRAWLARYAAGTDQAYFIVESAGNPVGTVSVAFERFPFEYPGGEKLNAETLFAHPVSGELYVVNKQSAGDPSVVFKFPMPMDSSKTATLIKVADLAVPEPKDQALTGGALSPDGTSLLLRMYNRLVELKLADGAAFETIFAAQAINVPVSPEQQGEAVAWRADGRGYFTASEQVGEKPTLNRVECRP